MTSSGVRKPNGAGLPMLSFRMCVPASSMRCASSATGPRTSYRTLSSLLDFLNSLIFLLLDCSKFASDFPPSCPTDAPEPSPSTLSSALSTTGSEMKASESASVSGFSDSPDSFNSPKNHSGVVPRIPDNISSTSRRGRVFPLTYWLTWLFPSFCPRSSAALIKSTCFMPHDAMASCNRHANVSWSMPVAPYSSISFPASSICKKSVLPILPEF